jgi:hypothetical protein
MRLVLKNDFHNTTVVVVVRGGILSPAQVKRAQRALCGVAGCTCGDFLGARGPQELPVGFEEILPSLDRDGKLWGRIISY